MLDQLLFIESPMQIAIVLLIALLVFGPKRLPEIGRQIGSALRELRKATNEVARSFSVEHEPDPDPYAYREAGGYGPAPSYYAPPPEADAPLDLTDYTIVGVPPQPVPTLPPPGEPLAGAAGPVAGQAADAAASQSSGPAGTVPRTGSGEGT